MKEKDVKSRIENLREEISRLRFLYHVKNDPSVTDDVYESLTRELHMLESRYPNFADINSMVNRVAGEPLPSFKKVEHKIRMLSMNDVFSYQEVIDWDKRMSKMINNKEYSFFCEVKLDGLSASLIYVDGVFFEGSTRGDGFVGENITENLKMIATIPMRLKSPFPKYLEVRGEVVMPKRVWFGINKLQEKEGKPLFANTRNAAAGSLRQLDPNIVKNRHLDFFAWDLAELKDDNFSKINNHSDKHKILRDLGFNLAPYERKVDNLEKVFSFIKEIELIRPNLPYGTDGIVISIDELDIQDTLGVVGKAPRYMVAFKYPAERATTKVLDITVNVGRTGVLTPVAHFNPTLVAGSTVSKATLHNLDQINRLGIKIGDTVVIQKAGDVIPEVVEVLSNLRTGVEKNFKMPTKCPVCNSDVKQKKSTSKDSVAFYCLNKNCSAKNSRFIEHFVNVYEIYEIGPKILNRLKEEGLITDSSDLFSLDKSDLSGLDRFGDKSADNIINSINQHKRVPLWRFIYALGIVHVGEETSRDLANHFQSLDKIKRMSEQEISEIENIGPVVAKSIYDYFNDKSNLIFIDKLFKNGVSVFYEKAKGLKFGNKIFVLTGTLNTLSREEAKKKIIENGGKVSSSVSSNTDYLIVGDNPGSKYNDARKNNVKIITEEEFLQMV